MFDDIIKDKANQHTSAVPPGTWENIVKKKKKRRFAFWWWSGAVLLLLVISAAGYLFPGDKKADSNASTAATIEKRNNRGTAKENAATNSNVNTNGLPGQQNASVSSASTEPSKETLTTNSNNIHKNDNAVAQQNESIQSPSSQHITVANEAAENDNRIVETSVTGKEKRLLKGKARVAVTGTSAEITEDVITEAGKHSANSKGKLTAKQTTPQVEEEFAVTKEESTGIENVKRENPTGKTGDIDKATVINADSTLPAKKEENKVAVTGKTSKEPESKKENTTEKRPQRKQHWYVDAAAIPILLSSTYSDNVSFNRTVASGNSIAVYNASLVKTSIEPAVAFSLFVRREINTKITAGIGAQYLQLKENISIEGKEINTLYTPVERLENGVLVADTVATVTEGTRTINAVNSYQLFCIPLFVQYKLVQKKQWSLAAMGGIYVNVASSYQNEINRNAATPLLSSAGTNKSSTGADVFAAMRISKTLGKRLAFFAMPSMRFNVMKYNIKNSLLNRNINQAGVGFGMSYQID